MKSIMQKKEDGYCYLCALLHQDYSERLERFKNISQEIMELPDVRGSGKEKGHLKR